MSRPHICFVQAQSLPWTETVLERPGSRAKVLSRDNTTGARTAIVGYPPGWQLSAPQTLPMDEEFLVLDGSLCINDETFQRHGYGFLPAGWTRGGACSDEGAIVLTMFNDGAADNSDAEMIPDIYGVAWAQGAEGSVTGKPLNSGLATKILHRNESTGEQSFLYCCYPHHPAPAAMPGKFGHPMVEEIFVLEGTFVFGDTGVMGPGGYCWWREGELHGPTGSETGFMLFIRNLYGPLRNEFSKTPAPFEFRPAYNPSLPADLKASARPYEAEDKW